MSIEILNWSILVSTRPKPVAGPEPPCISRSIQPGERRRIRCDVTGEPVDAGVFFRADLRPGDHVSGPALIVEPQTTTLVSADFGLSVDGYRNLVLTRREGHA